MTRVCEQVPTSPAGGWLSTRQAAPLLCGVTDRAVRNLVTVGTKTADGRVRLRAVLLGGKYFTRPEWVEEFLAATQTRPRTGDEVAQVESVGRRTSRFADEQARVADRLAGKRAVDRSPKAAVSIPQVESEQKFKLTDQFTPPRSM